MKRWLTNLIISAMAILFAWGPVDAADFGAPTYVVTAFNYTNITTDATTVIKRSGGILHSICINTPAATGTVTVYDNTAGSGTKIGTLTSFASAIGCLTYDANFTTGLTIVTATATPDITVTWQ